MKSAPGIAFDFRPSHGIGIAIIGMTLLGVLAVALSGIAAALKWLLAIVAVIYGICALRAHLAPNIARIAHGAGGWLLVDSAGAELPVDLVDSVRRDFFIMLGFRTESGKVRRVVLVPDNSDADLRRRLSLTVAASKRPGLSKAPN